MARLKKRGDLPTNASVSTYEYLWPALESLYHETKELSKKKPDGIVTVYKLKLINQTLRETKALLQDDPALSHIGVFEEESLPQYSDVVMVLGQYRAALKRFHDRYYGWDGHEHRWFTKEKPGYPEEE